MRLICNALTRRLLRRVRSWSSCTLPFPCVLRARWERVLAGPHPLKKSRPSSCRTTRLKKMKLNSASKLLVVVFCCRCTWCARAVWRWCPTWRAENMAITLLVLGRRSKGTLATSEATSREGLEEGRGVTKHRKEVAYVINLEASVVGCCKSAPVVPVASVAASAVGIRSPAYSS